MVQYAYAVDCSDTVLNFTPEDDGDAFQFLDNGGAETVTLAGVTFDTSFQLTNTFGALTIDFVNSFSNGTPQLRYDVIEVLV